MDDEYTFLTDQILFLKEEQKRQKEIQQTILQTLMLLLEKQIEIFENLEKLEKKEEH